MLVSNSLKFVFVHIHKCAGTSIELELDNYLAWNDLLLGSTETGMLIQEGYMQRFGLSKHSSADEIRRVMGEKLWLDYFTFAFVRHPASRLVSLYKYSRMLRDDWARTLPAKGFFNRLPFRSERVVPEPSVDEVPDSEPWNWSVMKALMTTGGFSSFIRSDYLDDELGARPQVMSLDDPVTGDRLVEFVGKVESIDQDWAHVCSRLNIPFAPLGKHNMSTTFLSADWREWYAPRDLDFVREKYDCDFQSLGYEI